MKVDAEGPTLGAGSPGTDATAAEGGDKRTPAPTKGTLGKYRLDRVIGEGGMGVVWAGYDPDLERAVAIKVLRDAGDTTLRTRLLREARAMARLKHPNVLTVYEVGTDDNRDFIAMDLVDGGDLTAWLANRPPRKDILEALLDAGRGLAAAHAAGLVHRDFKPHNVLRSNDARIYVTDFGLARGQLEPEIEVELKSFRGFPIANGSRPSSPGGRPVDSVLDSELTQTGVLIGTPAYMAPEQYAGKPPDPRTDQFSFCVTAWEALSGARPFKGDSLEALRSAVGHGVTKAIADLPSSYRSILSRGLDPEPAKRWPDMASLLEALRNAGSPRRRNIALAIAAAVVVVGGSLTFALASMRSNSPTAPTETPMPPGPPAPPAPPPNYTGPCAPVDTVFAEAWSPAKRAWLMKKAGSKGVKLAGVTGILDETRRRWISAYTAACAKPPSAATHAQISCLYEIRDEILQQVAEIDPNDDSLGSYASLGMLVASVERCGGDDGSDSDKGGKGDTGDVMPGIPDLKALENMKLKDLVNLKDLEKLKDAKNQAQAAEKAAEKAKAKADKAAAKTKAKAKAGDDDDGSDDD